MKVSTRGRYAVRALICLAMRYGKGAVTLKKISEGQGISVKYLENILRLYISSGMVSSNKGKKGGFVLTRAPEKIRMGEVVKIAEGRMLPVYCLQAEGLCPRDIACMSREMWKGLNDAMIKYLDTYTLADLAEGQRKLMKKAGIKTDCI